MNDEYKRYQRYLERSLRLARAVYGEADEAPETDAQRRDREAQERRAAFYVVSEG